MASTPACLAWFNTFITVLLETESFHFLKFMEAWKMQFIAPVGGNGRFLSEIRDSQKNKGGGRGTLL